MSARDKLREASFFYEKLSDSKTDEERRYFFSAFVSAWRSITFVLQKDYRGKNGNDFNNWYSGRAKQLREVEGSGELLNIRNVIQKEGNKYPQTVLKLTTVDGDEIGCIFDMSRCKDGLLKYWVNYAEGRVVNTKNGENLDKIMLESLPKLMVETLVLIEKTESSEISYFIGTNYQSIEFKSILSICKRNLDAVSVIVTEAEEQFGVPSY